MSPPPRFEPESAFAPSRNYRLLPFRFTNLGTRTLVVNEAGDYLLLEPGVFETFVNKRLRPDDPVFGDLKGKHLLADGDLDVPVRMLATKFRTKKSFLAGFTKLHIFVATLRCEHSCHYCQVSRVSPDRDRYDMTQETAGRALDVVFRGPAEDVTIEFQGGEPLLNFDVVRFTVEEARRRALNQPKRIQFVITTNLALLTDDILQFCREHDILISTSLDGPAVIHNANRPRPGGDSYQRTIDGLRRCREALGQDRVSALMTTTRLALDAPELIVDEYVRHEFDHIVLRPLSQYGFAVRTKLKTGYDTDAFVAFYKRALDHIIGINRQGKFFVEGFAQLVLTKILTPFSTGYVDLQSPAGAGISAVVYNYDGDVFVSDEARMLAEMGDRTFCLGSVHRDSFERLFGGELLRSLVENSCVEALPGCSDCALQAWCGADPVENYARQGDIVGHRPTSDFCRRNMALIKHVLGLYEDGDESLRRMFWSWVNHRPASELVPRAQEREAHS